MPAIADDCRKPDSQWGFTRSKPIARHEEWPIPSVLIHGDQRDRWSRDVRSLYDSQRRVRRILLWRRRSQESANYLERLFREQAERWKEGTQHWSSVLRMIAHPSYLRIIGLAGLSTNREIERLLLRELQEEPDYWFSALAAITGEDPVQPEHDFDQAVSAWLEWGRQRRLI